METRCSARLLTQIVVISRFYNYRPTRVAVYTGIHIYTTRILCTISFPLQLFYSNEAWNISTSGSDSGAVQNMGHAEIFLDILTYSRGM